MAINVWAPNTIPAITATIKHTVDDSTYNHFGSIARNPINGNYFSCYRSGPSHFGSDGNCMTAKSTDDGDTWSTPVVAFTEVGFDFKNMNCGYDSSGRLYMIVTKNTSSNAETIEFFGVYSDDDGDTWSSRKAVPQGTNFSSYFHKDIVELTNGDLLAPKWSYETQGGNLRVDIMKTDDSGDTWTVPYAVTSDTTGTPYEPDECSFMKVSTGEIILQMRLDELAGNYGYEQWTSANDGVTWTKQGGTFYSDYLRIPHPPCIRTFTLDSTPCAAAYYVRRDTPSTMAVVYAKQADLVSKGIGGWNIDTRAEITGISLPQASSGYLSVVQVDDGLAGYGQIHSETTVNTNSDVVYFTLPDSHSTQLKSLLGI